MLYQDNLAALKAAQLLKLAMTNFRNPLAPEPTTTAPQQQGASSEGEKNCRY